MKIKLLKYFVVLSLFWIGGVDFVFAAPPIKDTAYAGKFISQSIIDPISIGTGETKEITVKIKNTGKKIWNATGSNFVSAYTVDPNYHASVFYNKSWLGKGQPVKILKTTKPGETAEIRIKLTAPAKLGDYTEKFYLAAENITWIANSGFYFKIKVIKPTTKTHTEEDVDAGVQDESIKANSDYAVTKLAATLNGVTTTGGMPIDFVIRYNNSGKVDWKSYSWQEAGSRRVDDGGSSVNITDESWINNRKILEVNEPIKSGESFGTNFIFRAPSKAGQYILKFQLMADGHTLNGGIYELPVTVTVDAPVNFQPVVFASTRVLINEPIIRVGLYKAEEPVHFISDYGYNVFFGTSTESVLSAVAEAELDYSQGIYSLISNGVVVTSTDYIRLVPSALENYFIISNYDRKVSWKGSSNFNAYRGILEFKYSPKSDVPWVINELPLDLYIAGIGETSNGAAIEYIKAILVAARSYAYYQINNGTPINERTFDVYATTVDQLYLGYNSEVLMPRVVQAANNTYGEMVTYNGSPVTTPYFGHSNGKTKTWKEVWGGSDKPWLQPVNCIYDQGLSMFGHGVGMSAQDAANRADKDGWTYDQLLRYYYTGVEVEKVY
ncbi:MAG: SpoIID/LytB domain-containing protein [Candidatus Magasanikbacteria bacterium]